VENGKTEDHSIVTPITMNNTSISIVPCKENVPSKENPVTADSSSYRMVALDLDGTLLGSDHQMADEQATYLRDLHSRGFTVCVATGRSLPSVYEHVKKMNIPVPIPVVCSNGARGLLCDSNESIQELFFDPVPEDVVMRSIRLGTELGYATQYYFENDIYTNQKTDRHWELTALYSKLTGSVINHVEDAFESLLSEGKLPSKLLILFDEKHIEEAKSAFGKEFGSEANIMCGAFDWFVEVLNPNVTKGHGLEKMCAKLGIPLEQVVAMGDGNNDLEFLQMAGKGIAMKNGKDAVKKAADEVMEWTNEQLGVMKTLKNMDRKGLLCFS
jgi:Cof subfamily protein (haloacid dehalogenase superfamily)